MYCSRRRQNDPEIVDYEASVASRPKLKRRKNGNKEWMRYNVLEDMGIGWEDVMF